MEPPKIRLVCATRHTEKDFLQKSALGRSLAAAFSGLPFLELVLYAENRDGLPRVYNRAIRDVQRRSAILVFVHDDVHLLDIFWPEKLTAGLDQYRIVGLAGSSRIVPGQAGWGFVDANCTQDTAEYLSGAVAHGREFPAPVFRFGPVPRACKLLDGLFLAARSETLIANSLWFDESFDFHFYDLDFCRSAAGKGVSMGTCPISVMHESEGSFGSEAWRLGYEKYTRKWDDGKTG
jgi:GT2 family glycosyltransferase